MKYRFLYILTLLLPMMLQAQGKNESPSMVQANGNKLMQLLYFLDRAYIDPVSVDSLAEAAIVGMLEQLDPHSAYVTKEDMVSVNDSFDGNFEGIGVEFNVLNDTIIVVNTIAGGPSEMVGIRANDRIVAVDGKNVVGVKTNEVPKILRGPKGTKITATIVRRGESEKLDFVIERDKIPMHSLDAAYMIKDDIAYIKLNRFMATTTDEMTSALAKMPDAKSLILDLRGNGGGFLDQAISVSSQLLDAGKLVVYTEGRVIPRSDAQSRAGGLFTKGALVVLVDEESASASEIVAGAVQDWDRGLIIGRPTFGKGLVQRQIPLLDSSAVRITVARYHTPTGRVIQRPYQKGNKKDYYTAFFDRYSSGELYNIDSLAKHVPDSLRFKTLVKQRDVFGGGGIMPDIFVPIDTTYYSDYWGKLVRKGSITEYVVDYMDRNRDKLKRKYPTFESFDSNFEVTDDILSGLYELGTKQDVEYDEKEAERIRAVVSKQIKALIGQKLWDTNEYFRVINQGNNMVQRAVEAIENWDRDAAQIK